LPSEDYVKDSYSSQESNLLRSNEGLSEHEDSNILSASKPLKNTFTLSNYSS